MFNKIKNFFNRSKKAIDNKSLLMKEYGEISEQDIKSVERALKVSLGLLHSRKKERRNI